MRSARSRGRLAGEHVDPGVRPYEVELAAPPAVARGPELGRVPAADLEPIRVRRHVDQRREAGVRDGAVIALEEVLRDDLPVRLDAPLRAVMEPQRVDVDAELRDLLRHRTESRGERFRVGVRVHEEERPPALEAYGSESDGVELEVGPRRRPQAAVEPVRPGVVRALKRLSVPAPSATTDPRCRHTLTKARVAPSSARVTTTGSARRAR